MDASHSSMGFIDLTEDDDEAVSNGHPPSNQATTSRQKSTTPASRPNAEPTILDLTDDVELADEYVCTDCGTQDSPEWRKGPRGPKTLCNRCGLKWAKKKKNDKGESISLDAKNSQMANGNAGETSHTGAYTFFNHSRSDPENDIPNSDAVSRDSTKNNVGKIQPAHPLTDKNISPRSLDTATIQENSQESRKLNPISFTSPRKEGQTPTLQMQRQAATSAPLMTRVESSTLPQKRKQSSSSDPPEQPTFRTPPKVIWPEATLPKAVSSTVSRTAQKDQPQPDSTQTPRTVPHSPLRNSPSKNSIHMPQTRIFNSVSESLTSKEDGGSSKSSNHSPSQESPHVVTVGAANIHSDELTSLHQSIDSAEENLQDGNTEGSKSPTSASFSPDFDRGRFPYQRRRRGALGVSNPWSKKGPRKKTSSETTFLSDERISHTKPRNSEIERTPALRHPLSAGQSRTNLGSQRYLVSHGSSSKVETRQSYGHHKPSRSVLPGTDGSDDTRSEPGTRQGEQAMPSQTSMRQSCDQCFRMHSKCDHIRPRCGRCVTLDLVCKYNTTVQNHFKPGPSTVEAPLNQERPGTTPTIAIFTSQISRITPNPHQIFSSAKSSDHQRNQEAPSTITSGTTSNVRVKQEDNGQDDPNSVPDYLDTTRRTRGWHHDGYADVKSLFKRIALDAVQKKKEDFGEWPINLEHTTSIVREKAEKWANKKFGYFVNRLTTSNGSKPKPNDVEWLQRKVSQTFFEEATRAANNVAAQQSPSGSARGEEAVTSGYHDLHHQHSGERSVSDVEVHRTRSMGSLRSEDTDLPSISQVNSNLSRAVSPFEFHEKSSNIRPKSRPSRAAAGAAASRITSQYTTYVINPSTNPATKPATNQSSNPATPIETGASRQSKVFERRLCTDCDCLISEHNFHVHLATQKHKDNARQAEAKPKSSKENDTIQVEPLNNEQEPLRQSSQHNHRFDEALNTVVLRAQRKSLQGIHVESLAASLATMSLEVSRPYQGKKKRNTINKNARLDLLSKHFVLQHVDFTADEMAMIRRITVRNTRGTLDVAKSLANAFADPNSPILQRDKQAIKSQVQSLEDSRQNDLPKFALIESRVKDPNVRPARHIGSLLRHRELGSSAVGRNVETRSELKNRLVGAIKPWRAFRGASHDVVTVAWAPNSMDFAAGAVAHSNFEDLQYNRPCNLLLGDLRRNTLTELPDHWIDRQRLKEGPNSSQDMFNACDPKVYKTVTSIKFHSEGTQMYTASEDQTVKIWKPSNAGARCIRTIKHDASVTGLDLSPAHPGLLATASQDVKNAIRVFEESRGGEVVATFSSSRALMKPEWEIYPESLLWGPSASSSHLLLAGFHAYGREIENTTEGHLCLWDVLTGQDLKPLPASQAIHTVVWHPRLPYFATGGAPGLEKTNRLTTKTVVRAWDYRYVKRLAVEYECPSREMTDVTFHPLDHNIATAGCTNSTSYIWDFRRPDQPLHQLCHGKSIMPTGERDTGVMMSLWGTGNSLYYSGSSDGEIRAWDIRRHPDDVLVHTVARLDAGIQSGSFSPDGTHLLVGDATGGIHVLSSAPWNPGPSPSVDDDVGTSGTPMNIIRASSGVTDIQKDDENPGTEGIDAGRDLLSSGQLSLHPIYGPGQGPNYNGPYARADREPSTSSFLGPLKNEIREQQPFSHSGEELPQRARPIRILVAARKELLNTQRKDRVNQTETASAAPKMPAYMVARGNKDLEMTPKPIPLKSDDGKRSKSGAFASPIHRAAVQTPISKTLDKGNGSPSTGSTKRFAIRSQSSFVETGVIDNVIPESEMVEENDWWPQLGEEEITRARTRPGLMRG